MYAVRLNNFGDVFFLKGTTWTSSTERASKFETTGAALEALEKAKKFMARKSDAKRCAVIEVEG